MLWGAYESPFLGAVPARLAVGVLMRRRGRCYGCGHGYGWGDGYSRGHARGGPSQGWGGDWDCIDGGPGTPPPLEGLPSRALCVNTCGGRHLVLVGLM